MKNEIKKLFYLVLFLFHNSISAQDKVLSNSESIAVDNEKLLQHPQEDTIKVKILNALAIDYYEYDNKKMQDYTNQAIALSIKIGYQKGLIKAYRLLGVSYLSENKFVLAEKNIIKSLSIAKQTKKNFEIIKCLSNLGTIAGEQNNYQKSLSYFQQAILETRKFDTKENKEFEKGFLSNIGNVYLKLNDYDQALNYFHESLVANRKANYPQGIATDLERIGTLYFKQKKYDNAIKNHKEALKIYNKYENRVNITEQYQKIGMVYLDKNQLKEAFLYFQKALEANQGNDNKNTLAVLNSSLVKYYVKTSDYKQALVLLNKVNADGFEDLDLETKKDFYENLSIVNLKLGDKSKSYDDYKKFIALKDCLNVEYQNKEATKLQMKFDFGRKEEAFRAKQIVSDVNLKAEQKQKWLYIVGLGFVSILGGLLFYQNKKRKTTNQKLALLNAELDNANKVKTRFFGILNHDLRSPVSNLIHFLHLQKDNPDLLDEATKKRMEDKTILGAENLLSSMEDILLWSKGQMDHFAPVIKNIEIAKIFDDNKKVFSGYQNIKFTYENPENLVLKTDDNYLKTIIRNLTSNAINVLDSSIPRNDNSRIIWKAYSKNSKNYLSITDNGPGANQENFDALYDENQVVGIKSGLGLHLIRDLAKAINCEIEVDSKIGEGTIFILQLK